MKKSREHNSRDVAVFARLSYGARMRGMGEPWSLIRVIYSGVLEKLRYVTVHQRTNKENLFEFVGSLLSERSVERDLGTWF